MMPQEKLIVANDIAKALEIIEKANRIHTDVSLTNILLAGLTEDDVYHGRITHAALSDFNLASVLGTMNTLWAQPRMRPPEITSNQLPKTSPVDVFQFGNVLYQLSVDTVLSTQDLIVLQNRVTYQHGGVSTAIPVSNPGNPRVVMCPENAKALTAQDMEAKDVNLDLRHLAYACFNTNPRHRPTPSMLRAFLQDALMSWETCGVGSTGHEVPTSTSIPTSPTPSSYNPAESTTRPFSGPPVISSFPSNSNTKEKWDGYNTN